MSPQKSGCLFSCESRKIRGTRAEGRQFKSDPRNRGRLAGDSSKRPF